MAHEFLELCGPHLDRCYRQLDFIIVHLYGEEWFSKVCFRSFPLPHFSVRRKSGQTQGYCGNVGLESVQDFAA